MQVPPGAPASANKLYIKYYYWYATALRRNYYKTGNTTLLEGVLDGYKAQLLQFTTGVAPGGQQLVLPIDQRGSRCLYNVPGNDAQEAAISGPGCRPLVQSTMYGEAAALAELFAAVGDEASAAEMAAEAEVWRARVLQQWNPGLGSFDTIHPYVAPMPPGWTALPSHTGRLCNATLLFQGYGFLPAGAGVDAAVPGREGCLQRCLANEACRFMVYNDANDWCELVHDCNTTLKLNGLGMPVTWQRPASSPAPTPGGEAAQAATATKTGKAVGAGAGATPPAFAPFKTGVFCCDQSPCANGQSTFLYEGIASRVSCEAKCLARTGAAQ